MAKVKGLDKAVAKIKTICKDGISTKELRALAEESIVIVQRRARLGYGSPTTAGGQRFAFPGLSQSYVEFRSKGRGAEWLSDTTTPRKSNVTFTGQMLESIKVVSLSAGKVSIAPTGTRSDPFSRRGLTNAQVASYLEQQGRPFLNLTKPEVSQLVRFYRTRFGDLVKRST